MKPKNQFKLVGENITNIGLSNYGEWLIMVDGPLNANGLPSTTDYYNITHEELIKALRIIDYEATLKRKRTWLKVHPDCL